MNQTVSPLGFRSIDAIRNGSEQPGMVDSPQKSIVEQKLESVCKSKRGRDAVAKAVGWSDSMLGKFAKGGAGAPGIPVEKVAALLLALGLVTFTGEYAEYLAQGNVIGSNCRCARMAMGECGPRG